MASNGRRVCTISKARGRSWLVGQEQEVEIPVVRPGGLDVFEGQIFVSDTVGDLFRADGSFYRQWSATGRVYGLLREPRGLCIAANEMHVRDTGNDRVQVLDLGGTFARVWPVRLCSATSRLGTTRCLSLASGLSRFMGRFLRALPPLAIVCGQWLHAVLSPCGMLVLLARRWIHWPDRCENEIRICQPDGKDTDFPETKGVAALATCVRRGVLLGDALGAHAVSLAQ
jgi:hypothetical protein